MISKHRCIDACEYCLAVCPGVVRCTGYGYTNNFGDDREVGSCVHFKPKGKNVYRVSVPMMMTYDVIASDNESAKKKVIQSFGGVVVDDYIVSRSSKYDTDNIIVNKV